MTVSVFDQLVSLRSQLLALQRHALDLERIGEDEIALVDVSRRAAARNLVDYLALRQHELGSLQRALQRHGFSSLGTVQGHVMSTIEAVLGVLDQLCGDVRQSQDLSRHPSIWTARDQLRLFADETLGVSHHGGAIRIM